MVYVSLQSDVKPKPFLSIAQWPTVCKAALHSKKVSDWGLNLINARMGEIRGCYDCMSSDIGFLRRSFLFG